MQVAEILSDITSLRVCDYNEALRLVSVHKAATPLSVDAATSRPTAISQPTLSHADGDQPGNKMQDLQRAKELVQLHREIKSRHVNGEVDDALRRAREDVEHVMRALV